jgi:hypothetical protein
MSVDFETFIMIILFLLLEEETSSYCLSIERATPVLKTRIDKLP